MLVTVYKDYEIIKYGKEKEKDRQCVSALFRQITYK